MQAMGPMCCALDFSVALSVKSGAQRSQRVKPSANTHCLPRCIPSLDPHPPPCPRGHVMRMSPLPKQTAASAVLVLILFLVHPKYSPSRSAGTGLKSPTASSRHVQATYGERHTTHGASCPLLPPPMTGCTTYHNHKRTFGVLLE